MCMSLGAPRKPSYGACNELHGFSIPVVTWNNGTANSSTVRGSYVVDWTAYELSTTAVTYVLA